MEEVVVSWHPVGGLSAKEEEQHSPKFSLCSWKVTLVSVPPIPAMTGTGEGAQEETPSWGALLQHDALSAAC